MQPSTQPFFVMKVSGLARSLEDEFSSACFEIGASGVAEELKFVQKDLRYDPDVVASDEFVLNVYFEAAPSESSLLELQGRFPAIQLTVSSEENRDWLAEWKKGFVPFLFSTPFWVIPSWCEPPPEAPANPQHHIYVEPGMAFGTGTHETTRLAAALLIEELKRGPRASLLDVGTGTGILALIAARLGIQVAVGIDIDPEARRTARENLERNRALDIEIPDLNLDQVTGTYDLVVANIIDGVLTTLRHDLVRVMRPQGRLILSGVLTDRESEFYRTFISDTGLRILKTTREGEWSAALLERV